MSHRLRLPRMIGLMKEDDLAESIFLYISNVLAAEIQSEFLEHLDPSDWDFAGFLRNGKTSFQRHYKGYRSL